MDDVKKAPRVMMIGCLPAESRFAVGLHGGPIHIVFPHGNRVT
jgi:hypothetical protein